MLQENLSRLSPSLENDTAYGAALGDMFTVVVASLDRSGRAHLASIIEYCHFRREEGLDSIGLPVLFYRMRDEEVQKIAAPHISSTSTLEGLQEFSQTGVEGGTANSSFASLNLRGARKDESFNAMSGLSESELVRHMDEATRSAYALTRWSKDQIDCLEPGGRYLRHLPHQDPQLREMMRSHLSAGHGRLAITYEDQEVLPADNQEQSGISEEDDEENVVSETESLLSDSSSVTHEQSLTSRSQTVEMVDDSDVPGPPHLCRVATMKDPSFETWTEERCLNFGTREVRDNT